MLKSIEDLAGDAQQARKDFDAAASALRKATAKVRKIESQRAELKVQACLRLVQSDNPATPARPTSDLISVPKPTYKQWTWSDAKDFAQLDPEYAGYKANLDAASQERQLAEDNVTSAKIAAELANALVKASIGMGL